MLPLLLLYGLLTLGYWWFVRGGAGGLWWPVRAGIWYGLGLASVWLIYGLLTGVTPLDIAAVTFEKHGELVQREYLPWLLLHPYDTLMFSGWPLAGLFVAGCWLALRRLRHGLRDQRLQRRQPERRQHGAHVVRAGADMAVGETCFGMAHCAVLQPIWAL